MLAAELHLSDSGQPGEVPPDDPAALTGWLEERAPAPDRPALAAGAWPDLAGQPALAMWATERLSPATLSPAVARGLAVHAVPSFVLFGLAPDAGLSPEVLAVLLSPPLADRVASACPHLDPEMARALCSATGRSRAERGRDAALERSLAGDDEAQALWAVELASGLGAAGARIAEAAARGATEDSGRGHALIVLARTLPADAAVARLARHLAPEDPLAPVAALELSRLEGGREALAVADIDEGALSALVEVARARADGTAAPSGGGLLGRGL
jgi:hypothetical protein